jgi:Tol biopolymer transport system component
VLSSDGLELFFSSERSGGYGGLDIWVTKRATMEDPWGPPSDLGPAINVSTYDLATSISPDGLTLYFSTSSNDLMYTTSRPARDAPWGPPSIMAPATAGGGGAAGPVSADGLEFYFCSTRPGGYGDYDIWLSTRASTSDAWGPGVNLGPTINTAAGEVPTWLSPDGLTLLLTSDRPGGYGGYDAWITTRPSKGVAWGPPRNLGPSLNTPYTDEITAISPDGRWCLLDDWLSPRPGGCGQWDIWQAPIIPTVDVNGDGKLDSEDLKVLTAE